MPFLLTDVGHVRRLGVLFLNFASSDNLTRIDLLRQRTLHRRNSHKPPPGWDLILMPRVAKEFEVSMYRTAATLDEYKDLSTLRRRLRGLVERIRTTKTPASSSQKRSPAVTAISEEEKQMTVDLKEWQSRQQHRQQTKRDQLLSRQRLLANTGAVETARQYVQATTNDVRVAPLSVVDAAVDANASDAHSGDGGVLTSASAQPGMKEERSPPAPAVTVAKSETSITRAATKSIPCQCHSSLTSMARPQLVASSSVILGNSSPLFCSAPCASSPPPPPHQLAETEGILAKRHVGASSPRFVATCSPVICEMASSDAYVASSNKHHLPTFLKQKPISSARTYSALSQTIQTSEKQPSASTMTTHPGMSPLQQSHPVLQWPQTSFVKSPQESNPYQNPQENHHFNHGHGHLENGEGLHLVQQQRLLLLYHASQCRTVDRNVGDTAQGISDSSCPVTPHCATMKLVWNHVLTCEKPNCRVPHCNNSRIVLEHYRQCDKGVFCTICAPVRHRIRKDQQIQQSHGLSDHLELEPEAGFPPFSTKAECASPNRAVGLLKEKKRQLPQERSYSLLRDTTNYSVKLDEPSKMGRRVVSSKETSGSTYFYRSIERDEPTAPKTMQPRYVSSEATSATKTPSLRE